MKAEATVYLGLGCNLGDRELNISLGLELLQKRACVGAVSSLYETDPMGYLDQPRFLNAVCRATTQLPPLELLHFCKSIEKALGREPSFPNAPRLLDIDILLFGDLVVASPELSIPHPRLCERAFVLVPLAQIASSLVHPLRRKTVQALLGLVQDQDKVVRWQSRARAFGHTKGRDRRNPSGETRARRAMPEKKPGFQGIRDEVVVARTGKSSDEWYSMLDQWGAQHKGHTQTAKYLRGQCGLSPWWAQCIAIRHEWERGLRTEVHKD